jgi:hypothetical protein
MSNYLEFLDYNKVVVCKFQNIRKSDSKEWDFLDFEFIVTFDIFSVQTFLDAEPYDFVNLKKCIVKLYAGEWKSFIFNPIGERLVINFEVVQDGNIKVKIILHNIDFTGKLDFEFIMTVKSIPNFINQVEIIVDEIS